MRFRILAPPRIHMGLVDLAGVSPRSFCGVGFSISGPLTIWHIEEASAVSLNGISHLDNLACRDVNRIVASLAIGPDSGFSATLETSPPQHVGFGTKTSLLLALASAIDRLKGLNLSTSQIQQISGRGGASGVGINLFFCGGVLWDGGHPTPKKLQFLPSGVSTVASPPPILARWQFPERWLVGLILPDNTTFSGTKELDFFRSNAPIPADQVLQTMSSIYHGVVPAFATADICLLKNALEKVHSTGFKHRELLAQSNKTIETLRSLQTLPRIAVGLSSLGPLLYCVFDDCDANSQ